ncbi:hypothetical protein [Kitasatospora sp. A2-31]|uniref:hypothetical protein n=1 Tax=Kitasatospora sp. A2-31 TaxID=2916414 RepID=UPI001EEB4DD5|nr:hypothetical protein [Kitasatospora sp. A2-31]MCG6494739.1 hypothetical protein [Kitasatospora sp. A2-31]
MRTGTAAFLIGAAFAVLLALAIATVALGVVTALRVDDDRPSPPRPITRHGRWELRRLPDGTHEYAWIARQAGRFGPETDRPPVPRGRHRIPA